MKSLGLMLGTMTLFLVGTNNASADMINTVPAWEAAGRTRTDPFGEPFLTNTATYGQTFTATTSLGTQLDSFSFFLANVSSSNTLFSAYVAAWDGLKATGPILYTSASNLIPVGPTGFTQFTFNTGGISLTNGLQYVAFLSTSAIASNGNTATGMGTIQNPNVYLGGAFVFFNNDDFSEITTETWDNFLGNSREAAFQASFSSPVVGSATPEPASLAMLGMATATFGGYFWRRRKQPLTA